jgi:hypothetical protein
MRVVKYIVLPLDLELMLEKRAGKHLLVCLWAMLALLVVFVRSLAAVRQPINSLCFFLLEHVKNYEPPAPFMTKFKKLGLRRMQA